MITTRTKEGFAVTQTNGEHTIISDVGVDIGGTDTGLNPHELLEASLGACTTITVLMYARRKNFPVSEVITTVKVVSETGDENVIDRKIEFKGDLSDEQRKRLMEIADKCPMHKFLSKKSRIE
jgi:putative redox protein